MNQTGMPDDDETAAERKMRFLFGLRSKGVTETRVLTAMERIDRGQFVRGLFAERAYEDMPLPITEPATVAGAALTRAGRAITSPSRKVSPVLSAL